MSLPPQHDVSRRSPQLNYAQGVKLAWIGRHRRKLIVLAICVAIAVPIHRYREPLKYRASWFYWFNKAAGFHMPDKPIDILLTDPVYIKTVPTTNPDYAVLGSAPMAGALQYVPYVPAVYQHLIRVDARLGLIGSRNSAVAFMGTRRRSDGVQRLLIVMERPGWGFTHAVLSAVEVIALPLPGWFDPLPTPGAPKFGQRMKRFGAAAIPSRLKTGIPDPDDPTHISFEFVAAERAMLPDMRVQSYPDLKVFPFEVGGGGIIDAYLQNDDSVTFKLRSTWGPMSMNLGTTSLSGDLKTAKTEYQKRQAPSIPTEAELRLRE